MSKFDKQLSLENTSENESLAKARIFEKLFIESQNKDVRDKKSL